MSDEDQQDVRSLTAAEAKTGVEARAGRSLVLLIEDLRGTSLKFGSSVGAGSPAADSSPATSTARSDSSRAPAGSTTAVSATPAADATSKSAPELREARWAQDNLQPGEEAVAEAVVAGGDGASVNFIIERGSGGQWSEHSRVTGRVSGGKAVVTVPTPDTEDGFELRFHCELA